MIEYWGLKNIVNYGFEHFQNYAVQKRTLKFWATLYEMDYNLAWGWASPSPPLAVYQYKV